MGLHWGYIGIMEKKMETISWGLGGLRFRVQGLGFRGRGLGFQAITLRRLSED